MPAPAVPAPAEPLAPPAFATPVVIAGDTGPLLHIGLHGNRMIRRVITQMSGRLVVPNAVLQELVDRSHNGSDPDLQNAALRVLARSSVLFSHDQTIYPRRAMTGVLQEVEAKEAKRKYGHFGGHAGEVEAILYAERHSAILLTNDMSAREVAKAHRLEVASFATVLAVEVQDGRIDAAEAAQMCAQYDQISWAGEHNISPVSLATARIPLGFRS